LKFTLSGGSKQHCEDILGLPKRFLERRHLRMQRRDDAFLLRYSSSVSTKNARTAHRDGTKTSTPGRMATNTDWFAPGSSDDFWKSVYQAGLANGFLYDPGQGGTIFKINKTDGSVVKRINPFGTIDPNTYTASPLSTDGHGNILYNVVQISTPPTMSFFANDAPRRRPLHVVRSARR
jgi:hypothetical protein